MNTFLRRFLMNYGIYRRYPMGLLPREKSTEHTDEYGAVVFRICDGEDQ
jgi:hypothetical protein